jgi:hypothetical protein
VLFSVRGSEDPTAIVQPEGLCQRKKSNDTIGNRTRDLPAYNLNQLRHRVPHGKILDHLICTRRSLMALRFQMYVFRLSLPGIAGSNPVRGMGVRLVCWLCVV